MKKFGKVICVILIVASVFSLSVIASDNARYADTLFALGLFKGTDKGYELDKTFTREEAATILVRLLGEEKNSENKNYSEAFNDVNKDRWSFPYVMYCYENEITKGTANDTFSPATPISAKQFVTLVLRLLGYTEVVPETALDTSVTLSLLNSEVTRKMKTADEFTRNDMVYVVYRSLMTKNSDGKILADVLVDKKVITKQEAEEFDIYKSSNTIDDLLENLLD